MAKGKTTGKTTGTGKGKPRGKVKIKLKDKFEYYPEFNDPTFVEKIYKKREFHDHVMSKETRTSKEICSQKTFELMAQQEFLRNYISSTTPYNGILIFHGTGVGKTCTSIVIAEGFRADQYFNNKTIILTDIADHFSKEIYNTDIISEGLKESVQCTGDIYSLKNREGQFLSTKQKIDLIKKRIRNNYQIIGPIAFSNSVKSRISKGKPWNGQAKTLTGEMKKRIEQLYSNRVIIIDEIQNIKTKDETTRKIVPPVITAVIKYAKNIRLVLMSATPMFDNPTEIIFILNLLLLNDGRPTIKNSDIFTKDGDFLPGGAERLGALLTGYVSYLRGKNPITFPVRIIGQGAIIPRPKFNMKGEKIGVAERLKYTKMIPCPMLAFQQKWYLHYMTRDSRGNIIRMISNIIFPNRDGNGVYPKKDGLNVFDDFSGGKGPFLKRYNRRNFLYLEYKPFAVISDSTTIMSANHIAKYSSKFGRILNNILSAKGGISLVYSFFNWGGVVPFCMVLEQNGFTRYTKGTNEPALVRHAKPPPICYYCSQQKSAKVHQEGSRGYHQFHLARYVLVTADDKINQRNAVEISEIVNRKNNKNGEMIKVVVGNQVISEGIDFKRIRQVHIIEPWYNMSKIEQIVGRADRHCSHVDLPINERNVEIYPYALTPNRSTSKRVRETETIDEKIYARAEVKDIKIKHVERVLKESAVDCPLNLESNMLFSGRTLKMTTITGRHIDYQIKGTPYSRECDYEKKCTYKCSWMPKKGVKYPINSDTYRSVFSKSDVNRVINHIKVMYRKDVIYNLEDIQKYIRRHIKGGDEMIINQALDTMLKGVVVKDKFDRDGRLIYRGKYYVFQPSELKDSRLPLYYRKRLLSVKPEKVEIYTELDTDIQNLNVTTEAKRTIDIVKLMEKIKNDYNKIEKILETYIASTKITNIQAQSIMMAMILDRLKTWETVPLIENIITKIKRPNGTDQLILKYYAPDLIVKGGKVIGFTVGQDVYCLKDDEFTICDTRSIPAPPSKEKLNIIYGMLVPKKNGEYVFKIVDQSRHTKAVTKQEKESGRSKIRGQVCRTFKLPEIRKIMKLLGIKEEQVKIKIKRNICHLLEFVLRWSEKKGVNDKIWFKVA